MKTTIKSDRASTLIEMLVVIAVIGILAALLLPVLSAVKDKARRMTCLNNLRQINLGVRMFFDDSNDISPDVKFPLVGSKELMKNYVGLNGHSSPQDNILPARLTHSAIPIIGSTATFTLPMRLSMNKLIWIIRVIGLME